MQDENKPTIYLLEDASPASRLRIIKHDADNGVSGRYLLMNKQQLELFILKKDTPIVEAYAPMNPWGMEATVDLKQCDPQAIRDAKAVRKFAHELCDLIDMKRYGETVVVDFGEDPKVSGFSMTQLIESSLVSAHFVNQTNAVYLNIFSCKGYPPYTAGYFAMRFFGAKEANIEWKLRI